MFLPSGDGQFIQQQYKLQFRIFLLCYCLLIGITITLKAHCKYVRKRTALSNIRQIFIVTMKTRLKRISLGKKITNLRVNTYMLITYNTRHACNRDQHQLSEPINRNIPEFARLNRMCFIATYFKFISSFVFFFFSLAL